MIPGAGTCVTCGDAAVAARVVQVSENTATVDVAGGCEDVGIELIDGPVAAGDILLCHAGIALALVEAAP